MFSWCSSIFGSTIQFCQIMGSHGLVLVDVVFSLSNNLVSHSGTNLENYLHFFPQSSSFIVLVAKLRAYLPYVWEEECWEEFCVCFYLRVKHGVFHVWHLKSYFVAVQLAFINWITWKGGRNERGMGCKRRMKPR